jgi:uncharacterized protein YajQ (UPF0234 family)
MPSLHVVSEVNSMEVENAVNQAKKQTINAPVQWKRIEDECQNAL